MKTYHAIMVAVFLMGFSPSALALEGNVVFPVCLKTDDQIYENKVLILHNSYLTGFVAGYGRGVEDNNFLGNTKNQYYCTPKGVTAQQSKDVVCRYMIDNPKERHKEIGLIVFKALVKAFPCE